MSEKRNFKKAVVISIAVVLAAAVLMTAAYAAYFAYWGKRHSVLYDVKEVTVRHVDEKIYDIMYDVSVQNWSHDKTPHTLRLEDNLIGEQGSYSFEGGSDYFKTSGEPTEFEINVRFDVSTVTPYYGMPEDDKGLVEEVIRLSQFAAFGESGEEVQSANLYMSDNSKAKIVYV